MSMDIERKAAPGGNPLYHHDKSRIAGLPEQLRTAIYLFLLVSLVFLFLMPLFEAPFERDQGTYATIARGWMHGALPYRDLWDNKGPLLFLWYVLSFAWLGESTAAPRIVASLSAGLSVPFLWDATRRLFNRRTAMLAAAIYTVSFTNVYLQATANAEVFMLLPLTAGFWTFVIGTQKNGCAWYLLAGALTALAVFTRQSAVLTFAAYGAWLAGLYMKHPEERSRLKTAIASLFAGAVLGALPFVIYFWMNGALYDLWFAMFGFNIGWAAEQSFWLKFVPPLFIEPGPLAGGLIIWIAAAAGVWKLWKQHDSPAWLILSFLAFSEVAAQAMGKGSAHYSIQLLPGAAIAAALGFPFLLEKWRSGGHYLKIGLSAVLLLTAAAIIFAYAQPTAEGRFRVQYTFRDYADDAIEAPAIAKTVAENSLPGECIYEWGRSSEIYFLAGRQPCTRWFYNRPFEVSQSLLPEVMADLRQREPSLILVTGEMEMPAELAEFIGARYQFLNKVKYARIFKKIHY
jgi:4-amino-4-deoxy-L-arabinose transferase-like glycosyltransferase